MSKCGKAEHGGHRSANGETAMIASVLTPERSSCATVVDVSATTATLRGCRNGATGEDVWVKVGVIDRLAVITSIDGDLCTIRFDEPLSIADLKHLRAEAKNMLVTRVSPEERLAAKEWIDGTVC